jgi:hypothetical protein
MKDDASAYRKYPHLRFWYNKLLFSEKMGYECGPDGIAPKRSDWYIVRPIVNLSGMGIGAEKVWIDGGDHSKVPPGYFWCQWFDGRHLSVTYEWKDSHWFPLSSWEGFKSTYDLSKFTTWQRCENYPSLDNRFDELSEVGKVNLEFIGNNPIEIHLRTSPDPEYDILIPIWKDEEYLIDKYQKTGYTYVDSFDDANGFLKTPRLGFMVK